MLSFERRSNKPTQPGRLALPVLPLVLALAVAFAFAAASASPAWAGRYHVYSCRTPAGAAIPAEGWKGTETGVGAVVVEQLRPGRRAASRACSGARGGRRTRPARLGNSRRPRGTSWSARRSRGPGTRMGARTNDAADIVVACRTGSRVQFRVVWRCREVSDGWLGTAYAVPCKPRVRVSPANLGGSLYATAACQGLPSQPCAETGSDANGYAAAIYLYAADLVLEQQAGPSAGGVAGELASAATVGGQSPISFTAERPAVGHLRGRLLGGRPGGAEHRSRRRRGPMPEPGADERRPGGLPLPPALPPGRERPGRPRHNQDRPTAPTSSRSACSTPRATRLPCSNARSPSTTWFPDPRTGPTPPPRPPSR